MSISHETVRRLFGDIADHTVVEILETGASLAELESVAAYLAQEDDVLAKLRKSPLTGRALQIHEMLQRFEDTTEDDT